MPPRRITLPKDKKEAAARRTEAAAIKREPDTYEN